ncbi:MAG: hypothetical protein RQ866_07105, partial [Bacteroidales bacterium]|nr:hypothetical protein [Bacteroidales bacterium]
MTEIKRIFDLLEHLSEKFPHKQNLFNGKVRETWLPYSVNSYINNTNILTTGFLSKGLTKGDRVITVMNNRPEWNI